MLEHLLRTVSAAYSTLRHQPEAPHVRLAYSTLRIELWQQFQRLTRDIQVMFTTTDPYATSLAMFDDIYLRRQLRVYSAADLPTGHPLLERAPNGLPYNLIFRAVHDGLAHYPGRHSFSMRGEFRAFKAHCRMLSLDAQWAVATETLGQ